MDADEFVIVESENPMTNESNSQIPSSTVQFEDFVQEEQKIGMRAERSSIASTQNRVNSIPELVFPLEPNHRIRHIPEVGSTQIPHLCPADGRLHPRFAKYHPTESPVSEGRGQAVPMALPLRADVSDLVPSGNMTSKTSSPPPPPPPPPVLAGHPHGVNAQVTAPHPPPPPPPPPIALIHQGLPGAAETSYLADENISTPAAFIQANYAGENAPDTSRFIRIDPCRRNVLRMHHQLKEAELKDNLWLLRTGVTDMFYEKPSYASLRTIRSLDGIARGTLELAPLFDARPVSLETPKTVVSAALTAPTDDDVYGCSMGHSVIDGPPTAICHPCSEQRSEALDETSLIYTLILTTCQASTPFIHGAHFNGKQIYKLVKCGSREAAVAEAFHAASINGWNVVFSCVTRLGEEFDDRHGKVVRVPELWHLAQECVDKECIRIFY